MHRVRTDLHYRQSRRNEERADGAARDGGQFQAEPYPAVTKIILPGIIPNLLTSWKINLTMGVRIATIAKLVGALTGIGHGLVVAQEMFSVAEVFAWTVVLVANSIYL